LSTKDIESHYSKGYSPFCLDKKEVLLTMRDNDPQDSINSQWIGGFLKWVLFVFLALLTIWIVASFINSLNN
jgi:hypothetical protein